MRNLTLATSAMTTSRELSFEYFEFVLGNGLKVVAEQHPYVRSVALGIWVRLGSSFESASENGASHFVEHMVFRGTKNRSQEEIATVLESRGGDLNAFTDREFTCFHATVLKEDLELAASVLSDLVSSPLFDKKAFEKEKRVLLQELAMVEDAPDEWIFDLFASSIWKGEPLGQSVIGTKESISRLKVPSLVRFHEEHYGPENMVLSVAGNFDLNELKNFAHKYFNFTHHGQKAIFSRRLKSKYTARKKSAAADIEQRHLLIGYEGVGLGDPDRYNLLALCVYLGGGTGSRLFQEVREKGGLAYCVEADLLPFSDTGLFTIYAALDSKTLGSCLEIIRKEVEAVRSQPLSLDALERVKGQIRGTIYLASEIMEGRQESMGRNELIFGRYMGVEELVKHIELIDPDGVQKAARRLFQKKKESILTLGRRKIASEKLRVL